MKWVVVMEYDLETYRCIYPMLPRFGHDHPPNSFIVNEDKARRVNRVLFEDELDCEIQGCERLATHVNKGHMFSYKVCPVHVIGDAELLHDKGDCYE